MSGCSGHSNLLSSLFQVKAKQEAAGQRVSPRETHQLKKRIGPIGATGRTSSADKAAAVRALTRKSAAEQAVVEKAAAEQATAEAAAEQTTVETIAAAKEAAAEKTAAEHAASEQVKESARAHSYFQLVGTAALQRNTNKLPSEFWLLFLLYQCILLSMRF